jgi:hypothetical protein
VCSTHLEGEESPMYTGRGTRKGTGEDVASDKERFFVRSFGLSYGFQEAATVAVQTCKKRVCHHWETYTTWWLFPAQSKVSLKNLSSSRSG